jgi:hypothetical protein
MLSKNFLTYLPAALLELIGKILYFPIWWYSVGLIKKIKSLFLFLKGREKELGFSIWLKNIFVPMYGQRDIVGRLISFLIRFVQVIVRGFILFIWLVLSFIALLIWILFPIALFFALVFQVF